MTLDRPRIVPVRRANVAPVGWVTLPVEARQLISCLETRAAGRRRRGYSCYRKDWKFSWVEAFLLTRLHSFRKCDQYQQTCEYECEKSWTKGLILVQSEWTGDSLKPTSALMIGQFLDTVIVASTNILLLQWSIKISLRKWCKLLPATLKGRLHEELTTVKGGRQFDTIT